MNTLALPVRPAPSATATRAPAAAARLAAAGAVVLGLVWSAAALAKLLDPAGFAAVIAHHAVLPTTGQAPEAGWVWGGLPAVDAAVYAWGVIGVELAIGVGLLAVPARRPLSRVLAVAGGAMLVLFLAYLWSVPAGSLEDVGCGCGFKPSGGGLDGHAQRAIGLGVDLGLLALTGLTLAAGRRAEPRRS